MASTIKIKNSSTAGAAPTASDLVQGELAVNVTDKRIYTENASGTVVELGTNPSVPVTFPDGSASAPSVTNDGDTNTGVFFPAADTVGITTGGTERVRVDSSGNVGIGRSPNYQLDVYRSGTTNATVASANDNVVNILQVSGSSAGVVGTLTSHPLVFTTGNTERARIDSSGNLLVGTTTNTASAKICVEGTQGLSVERSGAGYRNIYMASGVNTLYFYNGTNQASLTSAGAWTNASDGRQKTNITEIKYGLTSILSSQPRSYNRTDVEGEYIGFIAQELKEVIPEVVFGDEDTQYSVDYGSLVAVAFKAIQELKAIVDAQAVEIAALKGQA